MGHFRQVQDMREDLYNTLKKDISDFEIDVGEGLYDVDIVGILERLKFEYLTYMMGL